MLGDSKGMNSSKSTGRLTLVAVFIVSWFAATLAIAILCDFDIYYEPQPHHKIIKDAASLPTRMLFSALLGELQSGLVVGVLAMWRTLVGRL